jgi:hypothetical protein
MKKNAHLHIVVDSDFLNSLKQESKLRGISVSELSRVKLSNNLQLDRIENLVREVLKYERKN